MCFSLKGHDNFKCTAGKKRIHLGSYTLFDNSWVLSQAMTGERQKSLIFSPQTSWTQTVSATSLCRGVAKTVYHCNDSDLKAMGNIHRAGETVSYVCGNVPKLDTSLGTERKWWIVWKSGCSPIRGPGFITQTSASVKREMSHASCCRQQRVRQTSESHSPCFWEIHLLTACFRSILFLL